MPLIRPKALQPGDLIAVSALSSPLEKDSLEMYEQGVAELEAMGFRVRAVAARPTSRRRGGGPRRSRRRSRRSSTTCSATRRSARSGRSSAAASTLSYLDVLDYEAIEANPKPLIGMSDISALLLAIHSRTGVVTFHGDLLLYGVGEWNTLSGDDRARQADIYRRVLTSTEPAGALPALSEWETWRPGRAQGRLLGGLLPRFLRIQATPWAFPPERFDGAILFLEELNAPTINVWNDLHVLRQAGVFDRIVGLLIGPVETVQVLDDAPQTLREVVLDVLGDRDIPVLGNVNFGHAGPNLPLPLGVLAEVDADARTISLLEAAVS